MKTTTRRTILAGAATLPLLPGAAYAASATLPASALAEPADPAVKAYRAFLAAYGANDAFLATGRDDEHPEGRVLFDRVWAARLALSATVATTPAGLALQVRFCFVVFGDPGYDGDIENPDDFTFDNVAENQEWRLLRSMLTAAERMADGKPAYGGPTWGEVKAAQRALASVGKAVSDKEAVELLGDEGEADAA